MFKDLLKGYKTYIGIAISLISKIALVAGWDIPNLDGLDTILISIIGDLIAVYGRFVAEPKSEVED